MNNEELNDRLLQMQETKANSWSRIISHLRRQFEIWAMHELTKHGYEEFKMAYMPVLMNILPNGITNNELARRARVTKQAMSKVVKELTELDFVVAETDSQDKRSSIIYFTEKGKLLVLTAREKVQELEKEYEDLIGKEKFAAIKEELIKIIKYHDEKHGQKCCF